ncbi:hypothetical protein RFI_36335, partial [Reticulomyxa filosa]
FEALFKFSLRQENSNGESTRPSNAPTDNIFQLLRYCNGDEDASKKYTYAQTIFQEAKMTNRLAWPNFRQKEFVYLVSGVFNELYVLGNTKHYDVISSFMLVMLRSMQNHLSERTEFARAHERLKYLLCHLACCDSDFKGFKNSGAPDQPRIRKDHVLVLRLAWHLVGVVLSLPQSPLSILFHSPKSYQQQYLLAMPEDQSASLLKAMSGHAAWLCPNNHLYFVGECTRTKGTGKCSTCGADIGNRSNWLSHTAAKGNRRLGTIDENGHIVPDNLGATEGTAEYDSTKLAPQGYVIIEGGADDACRKFNEVSVRIARVFVNLLLLVHGCCFDRSDARDFTNLAKKPEDVVERLLVIVDMYLQKIGQIIGHLSVEHCLLLMHRIVHQLYLTYEQAFPNGFADLSTTGRQSFETYLIQQCIDPIIKQHEQFIREIRTQTTADPVCAYWSCRVEEGMDLNTNEGRHFLQNYYVHNFLPFRIVTFSEFRNFVLKTQTHNAERYPVIHGILKTMQSLSGYSVFALQYLPEIINWVRLIHSRFNGRLTRQEVEFQLDKFNARFAVNKCKQENWGDVAQWERAWKGFADGWNHVVSRLTTDKSKRGSTIRIHHTADVSANANVPKINLPNIELEQQDKKEPEQAVGVIRRYLVLTDQLNPCENLPFQCFKVSGPNGQVAPKDVPLLWALDCGVSGPLETSKMLRLLLDHLVTINNALLNNCHNLPPLDEDSKEVPTSTIGQITLTHISNEKDVVGIDEEILLQLSPLYLTFLMIQQCSRQQLKYGEKVSLDINLELLETRLKENFILGRKFLHFDLSELLFELSGQHDIQEVISLISKKFEETTHKKKYFDAVDMNVLTRLKNRIIQNAPSYDFMNLENVSDEKGAAVIDINRVNAFKTAKGAVEQVLIALRRQKTIPEGANQIGLYMKDILHLHRSEFDSFVRTEELCLKHAKSLWEFLNRTYLVEENEWHKIPHGLLDMYRVQLPDKIQSNLQQFAATCSTESLWQLLLEWKKFLATTLSTQPFDQALTTSLSDFLGEAMSDDQLAELVRQWPADLLLIHAGAAFNECAQAFQSRAKMALQSS